MLVTANEPSSARKRGRFQSGRTRSARRPELKGRVFSLPRKQVVDGSIEAGLICLTAWRAENPGHSLSRDEIAFVCGCCDTLIWRIENAALKKLKIKFAALNLDQC
jgi:hypothetical protein